MEKEVKEKIRRKVLQQIPTGMDLDERYLADIIDQVITEMGQEQYLRFRERKKMRQQIFNSMRKLDVLQELIEDEDVTEIMVNGPHHIFIEKEGKLYETGLEFDSRERLEDIAQQIASEGNRIVNETTPILDVRLADGSRVNIVMPPIALEGPVITIRKFPKEALTMKKLIKMEAITAEADQFLKGLVEAKYNIFISGGTGAGKTTFLNILSNYIPATERIITIEDSAELQIQNVDNLVRMEARNANVEGKNQITIRDLIRSALRMRPDRIIVGEIRDATAIDMLAAMNTGHDGSLSTGHANSPKDMLNRLETLVLMGMDIPLIAIRQQISSAIDIIVHLGRLRDRSRKVLEICEVGNMSEGEVELFPLFSFVEEGEMNGKIKGSLQRTNHNLRSTDKCIKAGVKLE
ncbi:MAG: CpaF family protein [Clostridiales bacterium]|nr:CpaF family protein [Clostridiales bacterium]